MKLRLSNIPTAIYFIVTAVLIVYFFPREEKFRYQFYEGKPWRYGLLTAPDDFPIYKTDQEIQAEKDSVLNHFEPYYRLDVAMGDVQTKRFRETAAGGRVKIPSLGIQYLESALDEVYRSGIISSKELGELKQDGRKYVKILRDNRSQSRSVDDLFTVRTAYEYLLNNHPPALGRSLLQTYNLNDYLAENVSLDEATTSKVKDEMLNGVSISNGMVQAGERIVDRGQLIDNHIYNVLRSLKTVYEAKSGGAQRQGLEMGGAIVLVFGIISCFWLYLWSFRPKIFYNRKHVLFLTLCILTGCILTEICVTRDLFNVYIIPYAIVPIVVRTFFDSRTALFTHLVIVLICSLMAPFPHEFLLMQAVVGMVVTFSLKDLSERSQLIRCAFIIFLAYALTYISLSLYLEADYHKISWRAILYFGINFILLMFTYILVYMLEKVFGYVSTITLIELSNINTPVLKKLSETAPGTFQHSIQVSILASEAAQRIGANAQLVRTGAMYHDIGKMSSPAFFTENQSAGFNPHQHLTLEQSAQTIINHVSEGVKLAEKASLPTAIINFIRTHHGQGKAKFFYNSFRNQFPDKEIDETLFAYPGPNPFSKETAVLMMADSVEAASRSLSQHTEENIREMVDRIIDGQMEDGLLKNAPLTFRDVDKVKQVFVDKLKIMYHTRISYPDAVN